MKDGGREHEEEAEEEGREEEGGRDQLMPDGFQQNKCVFSEAPTQNQEHEHTKAHASNTIQTYSVGRYHWHQTALYKS